MKQIKHMTQEEINIEALQAVGEVVLKLEERVTAIVEIVSKQQKLINELISVFKDLSSEIKYKNEIKPLL